MSLRRARFLGPPAPSASKYQLEDSRVGSRRRVLVVPCADVQPPLFVPSESKSAGKTLRRALQDSNQPTLERDGDDTIRTSVCSSSISSGSETRRDTAAPAQERSSVYTGTRIALAEVAPDKRLYGVCPWQVPDRVNASAKLGSISIRRDCCSRLGSYLGWTIC